MNEFVLFSSGGARKTATDTGTTESITMATSDIATASLSTMSCPHSSGDRSHDTTSQVTSQVAASGDDLRKTMEALSSGGILSTKHAQLLVSLLSTDDVALLQRVLVTIANAAAFTSNQVCRILCSLCLVLTINVHFNDGYFPSIFHKINVKVNT